MHSNLTKYLNYLSSNLGHCTTCMRQSLGSAIIAAGIYGAGFLIWPNSMVHTLTGLMAVALTFLWLAHIGAYAIRAQTRKGRSKATIVKLDNSPVDRRGALGLMLRAASVGVAVSVPTLLWPSNALAFCGQCTVNRDCGSENSGWECKNTAAVNSGKVCNECVET